MRDSGSVGTKVVYLAFGVTMSGVKELLGMRISPNEGAKSWLSVETELQNRGVRDIFIARVDGLKGFPEAIESMFPKTQVQLCIVHLVRHSLKYVGWKERKEVAADLKEIYASATVELAEAALEGLEQMERQLPIDSEILAGELAAGDSLLWLSAGNPEGDLHDQEKMDDARQGLESGLEPFCHYV